MSNNANEPKKKSATFRVLLGALCILIATLLTTFVGLMMVAGFSEDVWKSVVEGSKNMAVWSVCVQLIVVGSAWVFWDALIVSKGKSHAHKESLRGLRNPLCFITGLILLVMVV